jgi:hypothetical protein
MRDIEDINIAVQFLAERFTRAGLEKMDIPGLVGNRLRSRGDCDGQNMYTRTPSA